MGFLGNLKAKVFGVAKAEEKRKATVTKPVVINMRDGGHKGYKTGAFGGVGTGRGRRGMPGRKLIKKTVKAGWSARYRVGLSVKRDPRFLVPIPRIESTTDKKMVTTTSTSPMVKAVTGGKA